MAVREPNVSGGAAQAFTMVVATLPMTKSIKIVAVDDSLGIILPDEILRLLDVKIGDELQITDTPNGILLSSDFTEAMESARKVMSENREVLRRLAE